MAERFRDASAEFRPILDRPQRQQRRCRRRDSNISLRAVCVGDISSSGGVVGNERYIAQRKMLAKALIIPEKENLVLANRSAQRSAEDIALKLRRVALIEVIASIEGVVAQKFVSGAVDLVRARCSHNAHLRARSFAVFGAVGIR